VCVICDGGNEEDLLASEFVRIAVDGFTAVHVLSDLPWLYTIGLVQSFDHPELVMTGVTENIGGHVMAQVLERVRSDERFSVASPPVRLCDCSTVAFGAVHPMQWERGRFDQWLEYYRWAGGELPRRDAIQVLLADTTGRFPPDPEFCTTHRGTCQPLLDDEPRHDVNSGSNREQRRRAKHGHGKRRC
jgi:hypothetical protein